MTDMDERRAALLVDGDNVSAAHGATVLEQAARLGRVDVARVYATGLQQNGWATACGFRYLHAGTARNAADLLLCIDAVEFALTSGIDAFALASSDGGFVHLAQRLRERGHTVLGLGESKTPGAFRMACTEFHVLPPIKAEKPAQTAAASNMDSKLCALIKDEGDQDGAMPISKLGAKAGAQLKFKISTQPERTWRAYLSNRPHIYDVDPRGPHAKVRVRTGGLPPPAIRA